MVSVCKAFKMVSVCKTFKNLLLQNYSQNSKIFHTNSPSVSVIKVCSNGSTTYIISELRAKDNLNIAL